jgi:4-amino-4-deoxy-L-arabinose transferase-like glycosyltransferase
LQKRHPWRPSWPSLLAGWWREALDAVAPPRASLLVTLGLYVFVLVAFGTMTNAWGPLHHDMTEAWAWGKEYQLGYAKHPPLTAWLVGVWFTLMPRDNWSFYLLAGLNIAAGLAGVWMLAGVFLGAPGRLASMFLLMLTPSFSLWALKFNVNAPLISTWPWTTYFFLRSLETRRIGPSICAGVLGGLALLTKYYSLVLFGTLLLAAALHADRRRYFASVAPYLSIVVGLVVIAPHVWWTAASDFPTIDYAISKTQFDVADARITALGSVAGAVAALGVSAAACFFAFGWRFGALVLRALAASLERRNAWMTTLAFGPLILTIAAYFIANARITIGFLLPAFFALPVMFLRLSRADVGAAVLRRLGGCVAGIWLTLFAASPAIAYYVFVSDDQMLLEPRRELAIEATRIWNEKFGRPLLYVWGEERLATAVTFYSPDNPSYFIPDRPEHTPWVSPAQAKKGGLLVICRATANWCLKNGATFVGDKAIRSTQDLAAHFFGRVAKPQRFVLLMRPPE